MTRFSAGKAHQVGLPPGSLVPVETPETGGIRVSRMEYGSEGVEEREADDVPGCLPLAGPPATSWLNVDGLDEVGALETLGEEFGLHSLLLEDIVNTTQRPKLDDYDDHLFLVLKMLTFDEAEARIADEQVSLVLGPHFVLSFQERRGDVFEAVRDRIRGGKGRIRTAGSDYLAYAIVDAVVDHYFLVLEQVGEWIDRVEEELIADPSVETMGEIHRLRREMLYFRRAVWPLREVVAAMGREDTSLVSPGVRIFIRDVYDHMVQVIDTAETYRELISGMLDTYLSSVNNRMSEVMKVLTIIATIFIPLTFLAGIYGMNFRTMPELTWRWAYPVLLGVMGALAGGMLLWFRRRDWI